ncbi:hypothetical protein K470DRAFT_264658 [Piedraia hortae CBS 480.64]|uniref:DUF3835 domain-containing protein n=1 Tax=Piedraia hortae CBS 480.64 TaxID=1314780 RepID=A0A6A7BY86_9PEZI|nr:hypothetical protein K470DRAFT_264658 [Piedraia hortae CBS 480.64]
MTQISLEERRKTLEETLQRLRCQLRQWHLWDAEYECLKEEIELLQPRVNHQTLAELCQAWNGDVVVESVIRELTGMDQESPRSGPLIMRDIDRRLEYVQQNIETLKRQFFDAEAKLEEFDFAARREAQDESGGLPLTEIEEELDENDNVVSSFVFEPEAQQARLIDSLRKVGVTSEDVKPKKPAITNASPPATPGAMASPATATGPEVDADATNGCTRPRLRKKSVSFAADTKTAPEPTRPESEEGKKCVTFAEKVAVAPAAPLPDTRTVQFCPMVEEIPVDTDAAARQKDLRGCFKVGDKVKILNDDDQVIDEHVILPEDEDEDDAQSRREMLKYYLNDVRHVVAQMDISNDYDEYDDDSSSHYTGSTYPDDASYHDHQSDDDDESAWSREKGPILTEEYHQSMKALEQRLLGSLDMGRKGSQENTSAKSSVSSDSQTSKGKKRVSFAEPPDASEPMPPHKMQKQQLPVTTPVSESIQERQPTTVNLPLRPSPVRSEKGSHNATGQANPPDQLLVETLVERPVSKTHEPPNPKLNELQQMDMTYQRLCNNMIQQCDGLTNNDDLNVDGLIEEKPDGTTKKISKFKAARLQRA